VAGERFFALTAARRRQRDSPRPADLEFAVDDLELSISFRIPRAV
jgi:hypothetical protein